MAKGIKQRKAETKKAILKWIGTLSNDSVIAMISYSKEAENEWPEIAYSMDRDSLNDTFYGVDAIDIIGTIQASPDFRLSDEWYMVKEDRLVSFSENPYNVEEFAEHCVDNPKLVKAYHYFDMGELQEIFERNGL